MHPRYSHLINCLTALHFHPYEMTAANHDAWIARISHLPYMNAVAMMHVYDAVSPEIVGPGFYDHTRVAAAGSEWGVDICRYNRAAILESISELESRLSQLKSVLQSDDYTSLSQQFVYAKTLRSRLDNKGH